MKMSKPKFFGIFLATVLVVSVGFVCFGCSDKVLVRDIRGNPIEDAEIVAVSLSMDAGAEYTNRKGIGKISYNIQGTKWVRINKEGYQSVWIDYKKPWPRKPVEIILRKQTETISDETDLDLNHE